MKSTSKKRTPTIENLTVKRRYLTGREVERLVDCARKHGRYGHRDALLNARRVASGEPPGFPQAATSRGADRSGLPHPESQRPRDTLARSGGPLT